MNQLTQNIELAERSCQESGKRLTKNRKTILIALLQIDKAVSAYDLVEYCKQEFNENIPVMSIYRILDFLKQQGLVHRLDLANKYVACSHISSPHKHKYSQFLICDQCQHVEEVDIDQSTLQSLQLGIKNLGFHVTEPQLELNGVCDKCFTSEKQQ